MTLAEVGVSLLVITLAVILFVNLVGWALTVLLDRRRIRDKEALAERAAHEAVKLAMEELRGNGWSSSR